MNDSIDQKLQTGYNQTTGLWKYVLL
jgi:hypothetical protein